MELYDALKAGTSKEDLLAQFNKELNVAAAKLEEEEAAETHAEELADAREDLADEILWYTAALLDIPEDDVERMMSREEVEKMLKNFEKEALPTLQLLNQLDALDNKKSTDRSDDEILNEFLKLLK